MEAGEHRGPPTPPEGSLGLGMFSGITWPPPSREELPAWAAQVSPPGGRPGDPPACAGLSASARPRPAPCRDARALGRGSGSPAGARHVSWVCVPGLTSDPADRPRWRITHAGGSASRTSWRCRGPGPGCRDEGSPRPGEAQRVNVADAGRRRGLPSLHTAAPSWSRPVTTTSAHTSPLLFLPPPSL